MSKGAQLNDSSVLDRMRGELAQYSELTDQSINEVTAEIRRVFKWLTDRESHWMSEVQRRIRNVELAEKALNRCLSISQNENYSDNCTGERRELAHARSALQEAQNEHATVKDWIHRVEDASEAYAKQVNRFSEVRVKAVENGKKHLISKQQSLDNYASTSGTDGVLDSLINTAASLPPLDSSSGKNPAKQGKLFQKWCNENVFMKEDEKLSEISLKKEENEFLDTNRDAGLLKSRRFDTWINDKGEIWELKSGYETSNINERQAQDYARMLGYGRIELPKPGGDESTSKSVRAVYYLFQTEAGARNNASILQGLEENIFICFIDQNGALQQLK